VASAPTWLNGGSASGEPVPMEPVGYSLGDEYLGDRRRGEVGRVPDQEPSRAVGPERGGEGQVVAVHFFSGTPTRREDHLADDGIALEGLRVARRHVIAHQLVVLPADQPVPLRTPHHGQVPVRTTHQTVVDPRKFPTSFLDVGQIDRSPSRVNRRPGQ
jgi:hypothetical protein